MKTKEEFNNKKETELKENGLKDRNYIEKQMSKTNNSLMNS